MGRTIAIAAVLALASSASAAQQAPIGVWQITYPGDLRVQNGILNPIMVTGKLTIEAQGDSLIAHLVTDPSSELPPRPVQRLAAKAGPGAAVFETRATQSFTTNDGAARDVTTIRTWVLGADGDALEGTLEHRVQGVPARSLGPQPVKGTRRTS